MSSLLATTRYQDIRAFVWHVQGDKAGQLGMMLNGHQRAITCLAFARRDEALIAAGDESGRVCVWRLQPQGGALGSWSAPPAVYTQANLPWSVSHSQQTYMFPVSHPQSADRPTCFLPAPG